MCKAERRWLVWIAILSLSWTPVAAAQTASQADAKQVAKTGEREAKPAKAKIRFVPRDLGAPEVPQIGGATRGAKTARVPHIHALVPSQVGYTLEASPTLYWRLSHDTEHRVDFTLTGPGDAGPELQVTLPGPFTAGVHAVSLADPGFELRPSDTHHR